MTLACDDFAVSIDVPHATTITETFSFDAVLDQVLCPGASKPMSIALDFKDCHGMAASGVAKAPAIKIVESEVHLGRTSAGVDPDCDCGRRGS